MPSRPIAKVSPEEVVKHHAASKNVSLSDGTAQLLSPIVGCITNGVFIDERLVTEIVKDAVHAVPNANFDPATYVDGCKQHLLSNAHMVCQDANGDYAFSPDGFAHVMLQIPGPQGDDLRTLFSSGNTGAELDAAVNHIRTERQNTRDNLADTHNRNTQAIVQQGIADPMFPVREEKRFYASTIESTAAALTQKNYPLADIAQLKGSSMRAAYSTTFGATRDVAVQVQELALRNHLPGGVLADQTPEQMRARLRAINDGGARSYNAPRPTIHKRRDDAFVSYVAPSVSWP